MLVRILVSCGLFAAAIAVLTPFFQPDPPQLALSDSTIDFGDADPGTVLEAKVRLKNNGGGQLVITDLRSSCGCTVATVSQSILKSQEEATIQIRFTPGSDRTSSAVIRIATNAPTASSVAIPVRSRRPEKVFVSPEPFIITESAALNPEITLGLVHWTDPQILKSPNEHLRIEHSMNHIDFVVHENRDQSRAEIICRPSGRLPTGVARFQVRIFEESLRINRRVDVEIRRPGHLLSGPPRIVMTPDETQKQVRLQFRMPKIVCDKIVAELDPPSDLIELKAKADQQGVDLQISRKSALTELVRSNGVVRCLEASGVELEAYSTPAVFIPKKS